MVLLLWSLLLAADPGLHVYRSRAELPRALAKTLPADFDFKTEMLAGEIVSGATRLVLKRPHEVRREGRDTVVTPEAWLCPPCSGIDRPPEQGVAPGELAVPPDAAVLWRVPRAKGRVYARADPPRPCEPCTRP